MRGERAQSPYKSFSAHSVDRIDTEPKWRRRGGGFPSGRRRAGAVSLGGGGAVLSVPPCEGRKMCLAHVFSLVAEGWWVSCVLQMARVPYVLLGVGRLIDTGFRCYVVVWSWGGFGCS